MDLKDMIIVVLVIFIIVLFALFLVADEAYKETLKQRDDIWELYNSECDRNIEQLKQDILSDDIDDIDELPW